MSRDIEDANEADREATRRGYEYQPIEAGYSPDNEGTSNRRILWTCSAGILLGFAAAACFFYERMDRGKVHDVGILSTCRGKDCRFDCSAGKDEWEAKWSASKKLYCCGMTCLAKSVKADAHNSHVQLESRGPSTAKAHRITGKSHSVAGNTRTSTSVTTVTITTVTVTVSSTGTIPATTMMKLSGGDLLRNAQKDPTFSGQQIHQPSILKGISYCPVPVKSVMSLKSDDWMTDLAKPLWSAAGRGDLEVMHSLGANAVRLYGNNPELQHGDFLDEAQKNALHVIPGMSDFPYTQDPDQNCIATEFNCFSQVKKQYSQNLKNGFLKNGQYHPALSYFILINEPDLKVPTTADSVPEDSQKLARAIISAFDAVLDAEQDAGVHGPFINFTATFSYAICSVCPKSHGLPALGQMLLVEDAMMHPEKYGYKPRHFLYAAYLRRWVNSFNTANEAADLHRTFFSHYEKSFSVTPVFIGEYHKPGGPVLQEVQQILQLADQMPLFLGINFFEFQVSYWKGGSEMQFGLFGLGGYPIGKFSYADGSKYTSWCLSPEVVSGTLLPEALAAAYGGHSPSVAQLCLPQAETVPISTLGYNLIVGLKDTNKTAAFISRVAGHLGYDVIHPDGLHEFAKVYMHGNSGKGYQFDDLMKDLQFSDSDWLHRSSDARCVADRNASQSAVEKAITWGCGKLAQAGHSCDDIDAACHSAFQKGDWVFSRYYKSVHKDANALEQCNFGGAAVFSSPKMYQSFADPACIAA